MEFGQREEAEVLAAILGAVLGYFLRPWGLGSWQGVLAGLVLTWSVTVIIGRLGDDTFSPDNSALLGVFVTGLIMHSVAG